MIDAMNTQRIVDCWRTIGVRGDRSCPELRTHLRCNNCPTYHEAAQLRLAQLPITLTSVGVEALEEDLPEVDEARINVLACRLGDEWLGIPTRILDEVGAPRPVHSVPHRRRGALLGLVNVRGTLTPCISLARVLSLPTGADGATPGPRARLLMVRDGSRQFAVPVDEVDGIHPVRLHAVKPAPATVASHVQAVATNVADCGARRVGLVDPERLLRVLSGGLA